MLDFLERAGNFDSRNRSAITSHIQVLGFVNIILERALVVASLKDKPSEEFILKNALSNLRSSEEDEVLC